MDKIDKYLCNLFNNDKSAGVIELKEELKCHLLDMAHEFISQGHSKEEAYDMAINKFDIDNDVLKILCENAKHTFLYLILKLKRDRDLVSVSNIFNY